MKRRKLVSRLLYWLVAGVFLVAGAMKIVDPEHFLSSLLTYDLLGYRVSVLTALFVPYLEIVAALCLGLGFWRIGARWLIEAMLVVFIVFIVQARARGLSIDCGCFGENILASDWQYAWKLSQDALLLGALWLGGIFESDAGRNKASSKGASL